MHASDKIYALDRAVKLAQQYGEPQHVVDDLKRLRDEAIREARGA